MDYKVGDIVVQAVPWKSSKQGRSGVVTRIIQSRRFGLRPVVRWMNRVSDEVVRPEHIKKAI